MDRGTWWATVHGVTKSQTGLREEHFTMLNRVEEDERLPGPSLVTLNESRTFWTFNPDSLVCARVPVGGHCGPGMGQGFKREQHSFSPHGAHSVGRDGC